MSPPDPFEAEEVASYHDDPAIQEVIDSVRLHGSPEAFERSNHIIEYSIANQINILNSSLSSLYKNKSHYIAPLIGSISAERIARNVCKIVTMFGRPDLGRRGKALQQLRQSGADVTNIRNFENYSSAFKDYAILVNLAQKSYLQTPEELRILPALLEGLLVITEENRFLDQLPYRDFLITSSVRDLPYTVRDVSLNYPERWHETFQSTHERHEDFTQKLHQIHSKNIESFAQIVMSQIRQE